MSGEQLVQEVQQLLARGQGIQAEKRVTRILKRNPKNPSLMHLMGFIKMQLNKLPEAESCFIQTIGWAPAFWQAYLNLGIVLRAQGKLKDAKELYVDLISKQGGLLDAQIALAVVSHELGQTEDALVHLEKVLTRQPNHLEALFTQGTLFLHVSKMVEAKSSFRRLLEIAPRHFAGANNLGSIYEREGNYCLAIDCFSQAISNNSKFAPAIYNRGKSYQLMHRLEEAAKDFSMALALEPDNHDFQCGLAWNEQAKTNFDLSIELYRRILEQNPLHGNALSSMLMSLNYITDCSPEDVAREHIARMKVFSELTPRLELKEEEKGKASLSSRIRVGYVSADLREHSVAYFLLPLLSSHNREKIEVFAYHDSPANDGMTEKIKAEVEHWRLISGRTTDDVVKLIAADHIDILVDLSGHTKDNRLRVFASKPAKVQATWLGYPATTGLEAMDYRIVDSVTDTAESEGHCSESLLRLPLAFLCYQGRDNVAYSTVPPVLASKKVTFGSFNNILKVTDLVLSSWAQILRKVGGSTLVLKSRELDSAFLRNRIRSVLASHGVQEERVTLLGRTEDKSDHLSLYNDIDIALDTFPYNGTTTTMEALWMGVPVVAYKGDRHAARVSASLLKYADLEELVAEDLDGYVELAVSLAKDPQRLKGLRESARDRLKQSPVCDGARFARDMEKAFETMLANRVQPS